MKHIELTSFILEQSQLTFEIYIKSSKNLSGCNSRIFFKVLNKTVDLINDNIPRSFINSITSLAHTDRRDVQLLMIMINCQFHKWYVVIRVPILFVPSGCVSVHFY